jgi:protein arginine N-methyltransferase 5
VTGSPHHKDGLSAYQQYIRFLHRKQSPLTDQEHFEAPYWDYLQAPLQPLMDNLESQTYETFERDPVKYREYERACFEGKTVSLHRSRGLSRLLTPP